MRRVELIWASLLLAAGACFVSARDSAPKVSVTRWPQDRAAAISLTFDDGIDTHLAIVRPILRKHHITGTFFVNTGREPWEKRKTEWKQLADEGNELGNHTVHHPCLLPEITPHSQNYTPDMMESELRDAARDITSLLGSQRGLTFAYPCGNMSFGKPEDEVRNAALYLRYVSEYSFGARAVGSGADNPDELNVLAVTDLGVTADKDFLALLNLAEPAIQGRNWGVYCFHGVGGDWLPIAPEALDELASYLERHPEIWTATFGDVLRYIQERKAADIQITQSTANSIELALSWPMDKRIYDLPLTLKLEGVAAWTDIVASADGKQLVGKVRNQNGQTEILLDVPAQTARVRVTNAAAP